MENWSAHEDDRPYVRPVRSFNPWIAVAVIGAAAWFAAFSFRHWLEPAAPPPPAAAPALPQSSEPATQPAAEPAIRHQLEAEPAPSLPTLENSDALMRRSIAGLIGGKAFEDFVMPDQLVRRVVATVDNLPQRTAPTRVMPLNAVPGRFHALGSDAEMTLDSTNFARYAPYVGVMEALDSRALVQGYARAYPLFQRAYEELGYPGKYFNDRLMQAIDDLLAAPEVQGPIKLIRAKVLYEFAEPDLETRSAAQKILIRMGGENAARVKAKLWEIRRELIAAGRR